MLSPQQAANILAMLKPVQIGFQDVEVVAEIKAALKQIAAVPKPEEPKS